MELESCPFCGGNAEFSLADDGMGEYVFAYCGSCGIRTPKFFLDETGGRVLEAKFILSQKWKGE